VQERILDHPSHTAVWASVCIDPTTETDLLLLLLLLLLSLLLLALPSSLLLLLLLLLLFLLLSGRVFNSGVCLSRFAFIS
jgi:hypothetical protein